MSAIGFSLCISGEDADLAKFGEGRLLIGGGNAVVPDKLGGDDGGVDIDERVGVALGGDGDVLQASTPSRAAVSPSPGLA